VQHTAGGRRIRLAIAMPQLEPSFSDESEALAS